MRGLSDLTYHNLVKFNKIYLHAGGVKTGSTAFQVIGSIKHEDLKAHGIYYPVVTNKEYNNEVLYNSNNFLTSGNISHVCDYITNNSLKSEVSQVQLHNIIDKLVGQNIEVPPNMVLSSENVFWFNEFDFSYLLDALRRFLTTDGQIILLFCIRDIYEHALSWWSHMVRRHALDSERFDYIISYYNNVQYKFLKNISKVFSSENVIIVNYHRNINLWKTIEKHLNTNIDESLYDLLETRFNSSLDLSATLALQRISKVLPEGIWQSDINGNRSHCETYLQMGNILGAECTDSLDLYRFSAEQLSSIEDNFTNRFDKQVEWVNSYFSIENGPFKKFPWSSENKQLWINKKYNRVTLSESDYFLLILKDFFKSDRKASLLSSAESIRVNNVETIRNSGIFDSDYYINEVDKKYHNKVKPSWDTQIMHFLDFGLADKIKPTPFFDVGWYMSSNGDLQDVNPILHYIYEGAREGRAPHPEISVNIALKYRYRGNLVALLNLFTKMKKNGNYIEIPSDLIDVINHITLQTTGLND